jgi:hypothetical protein
MKSAYELAMERLEKSSPTVKLSEEQRAKILELDSVYKAKIAERETFLNDQIRKAKSSGDVNGVEMLQQELVRDLQTLRNELEEKKEKARAGK